MENEKFEFAMNFMAHWFRKGYEGASDEETLAVEKAATQRLIEKFGIERKEATEIAKAAFVRWIELYYPE